jgi:hypothetical protein
VEPVGRGGASGKGTLGRVKCRLWSVKCKVCSAKREVWEAV